MKEARKALETSSLGRKPRFRLSQLIQSVLMTRTTTDVREMSTVLRGDERSREGGTERQEEVVENYIRMEEQGHESQK